MDNHRGAAAWGPIYWPPWDGLIILFNPIIGPPPDYPMNLEKPIINPL